jgi:5-methylcytosine-specific restriction enzyme A
MSKPKLTMLRTGLQPLRASNVRAVEATKRITGNSLYALMRSFELRGARLCAECKRQKRVSYGMELDHIKPLHLGGSNAPENLQWLCVEHHREKSQREEQSRRVGQGGD